MKASSVWDRRREYVLNAETQRRRREDEKEQRLFSLRFLCVLCVSALKRIYPLIAILLLRGR
jgi:hypothetical protein